MSLIQIFARPPVSGKVKTRLMTDIGANAATEIYRYCLFHTLGTVKSSDLKAEVWLSEPGPDNCFGNLPCHIQQGPDLGERMLYALSNGHANNAGEPVLLIGSDCLDLRQQHFDRALDSLAENDLVFLPSVDGGFAMIGCRQIDGSIFDQVVWSSNAVMQQILKNAVRTRNTVGLLDPVRDIDRLDDLRFYPELQKIASCC